jgi:hypothetical protein
VAAAAAGGRGARLAAQLPERGPRGRGRCRRQQLLCVARRGPAAGGVMGRAIQGRGACRAGSTQLPLIPPSGMGRARTHMHPRRPHVLALCAPAHHTIASRLKGPKPWEAARQLHGVAAASPPRLPAAPAQQSTQGPAGAPCPPPRAARGRSSS